MTDFEIFERMRKELYTGLVCDVMDGLGYRNQALSTRIRPLEPDNCKIAGRAKTILAVDVYETEENPYVVEIAAIDSIKPGEVPVVCTNNSPNNGIWGGLLSTATKMRGGTGAIVDGLMRDSDEIRELNFPVFCAGYKPLDSNGRGKVIAMDCPVVVGDVRVEPGDVVFADFDGVVIIPAAIFDQVVTLSFEKHEKENNTKRELLQGALLADVYAKYGVL